MVAGSTLICFDERILSEHQSVLARRKFGFDAEQVTAFLEFFETTGQPVLASPLAR